MAQLPPKVPNIMHQDSQHHQQQWQEFLHPHHNNQTQNPPWVDEFIEFTAAKRGAHRRTVSESSAAFIEAGRPPETTERGKNNNEDEFDKFDDEQFMSMFSNELGRTLLNPSSTSDHNSTNDDQTRPKTAKGVDDDGEKAEEVESSCQFEKVQPQSVGVDHQATVDPKRVKRILANRQSAQRSRVRKLQYISELERSVTALQSEISALSPRVAFLDHQRMIISVDNNSMKAKIAALAQDKIFKDAHQEAMKREIERLQQVYYQQNLNKTTDSMIPPPSTDPTVQTAQE